MNFKFSPFLFLRTPAFSYQLDQAAALEPLLNQPYFRMAIFAASEQLYRQLEKKQFIFNNLDIRLQDSLRKYVNRMCYRPTPFGLFSSFSSISWSSADVHLILSDDDQISVEPDYQVAVDLLKQFAARLEQEVTFRPNSTLYCTGNEFRYFRKPEEETGHDSNYTMLSFGKSKVLTNLFKFCQNGKTSGELKEYLSSLFDDDQDVDHLFTELKAAGILVSEVQPNMTGQKFVHRLPELLSKLPDEAEASQLIGWLDALRSINNRNSRYFNSLPQLAMFAGSQGKHPYYVTQKREASGGLNTGYQDQLMELLTCCDRLISAGEPASISAFRAAFVKKYDGQEIPLLVALDPERGVGYEKLEQLIGEDELISGIPFGKDTPQQNIGWGPVQQLLMKKWTLAGLSNSVAPIEISDADLKDLPENKGTFYPASMPVLFRVVNDRILLEQAGGVTASALTGRFTPYCEKTLAHNRSISAYEEAANPGIIFAEVAHVNYEHAANINTREHFREYEIPVVCHSTLPPEKQIELSDLLVSVSGNRIILRSARLNKVVVPRHSTAYNHQRSELPVFRFLCDLQYHGIKTNFTLDLQALFPGLTYYPAIAYKGNLLATAIWVIKKEELQIVFGADDPYSAWREFSASRGICRFFALTSHDNQLVFDSDDRDSVLFFIRTVNARDTVTLKQFIMPEDNGTPVTDENGCGFINQFVASIYNADPSYSPLVKPVLKKAAVQRTFLPGNEWLYFKIYSHTHSSDRILTEEVTSIVKKLKKLKLISSWFFIRYYDPDHHIRLRFRICNHEHAGEVISIVNHALTSKVMTGAVSNIVIDSYCREIERYGSASISGVENVFCRSSEAILKFLSGMTDNPDLSRLHLAVITVDDIFTSLGFAPVEAIHVLEGMYTSLLAEFGASKKVRVEMDSKYRKLAGDIGFVFKNRPFIHLVIGKKVYDSFTGQLRVLHREVRLSTPAHRNALIADLIHMQLNRIFPANQRKNEMVVYYLLAKYYQSAIARRAKDKLSPAA